MLLCTAIVLLGTQGICAAAAAVGGVTFVAGMLPGPARQSVWKWLSIWGIAVLAVVGICAFVPFFGIAVDATITDGPDLMVERILLIDVLAIAGAAGHRRLLTGITSFGQRMAMRMRYAKVGGTHLPGDTSELGAALAMNSPAAMGGYGGGLRAFTGGGGGRYGMLGTRQRLMGALGSLVDGAGMPVDTGGILADATAEAGRGLAPLTAAAAVGGLGARLGAKGAHWLLVGRRPDKEQLAKWRKPTADGDPNAGGPLGRQAAARAARGRAGPAVRPTATATRTGQVVDRNSGQVLHDQNTDRTLLSTRAHNRLVRFRGYRILNRGRPDRVRGDGRCCRQTSAGPGREDRATPRTPASRCGCGATQSARTAGPGPTRAVTCPVSCGNTRTTAADPAPSSAGVCRPRPAPAPRPSGSSRSPGRTGPASPRPSAPASSTTAAPGAGPSAPPTSPTRLAGGAPRRPASPAPERSGRSFPEVKARAAAPVTRRAPGSRS